MGHLPEAEPEPTPDRMQGAIERAERAERDSLHLRKVLEQSQREAQHLRDQLAVLEGSRSVRLVKAMWRWREGSKPEAPPGRLRRWLARERALLGNECIVGCVTEDDGRLYDRALRLVSSWRWFGGDFTQARFLVCVVGDLSAARKRRLEIAGAEVRLVEPVHSHYRSSNRLRFLELAAESDREFVLCLDCDTVITQNPLPWLWRNSVQLKVEDLPTVPLLFLERLFARYGMPMPPHRLRTTFERTPTITYCNAGVLALPRRSSPAGWSPPGCATTSSSPDNPS